MPFFRGDHDNPVGCFRPVQGGGGGIFQNIETFNILGIYSGNGITDTIDVVGMI